MPNGGWFMVESKGYTGQDTILSNEFLFHEIS